MEYIELHIPGEDRTPAPWYCGPDFVGAWCWQSYRRKLHEQGVSQTDIALIDSQTTELIQSFEPPTRPSFFKTVDWPSENRIVCTCALIAKAIDLRYTVFLVLEDLVDGLDQDLALNEFSSVSLLDDSEVAEFKFDSRAALILNVATGAIMLGRNSKVEEPHHSLKDF